jgi:hypothetical protein
MTMNPDPLDHNFFLNRLRSRERICRQTEFPKLAAEIKALLTAIEDGELSLQDGRRKWRDELERRYLDISRGAVES